MPGLFSRSVFQGFGPTSFDPIRWLPWQRVQGQRASILKARLRKICPQRPGVYGMIGVDGQLIYVGKAKRLRARLLSYFRPKSRLPKAGEILERSRAIAWEFSSSEFAALLRELELIHRWRPCFNVQGQPQRWNRVYVCLGRKPAPYVFLFRRPLEGMLGCFGPVASTRRTGEAVRWLNDFFRLRDCSESQTMHFAEQGELFPVVRTAGCLRYEIGTCLGPCAARCSQAGYLEQARLALAFLAGTNKTPITSLEREMDLAAAAMKFEQAACLRDQVDALRWLDFQLERLRTARRQFSFVYSVKGFEGRDFWYLIHRGRVAATISSPKDPAGHQAAAEAIRKVFHHNKKEPDPLPIEGVDQVLLVTGWFRRHPEQRAFTQCPESAGSGFLVFGDRGGKHPEYEQNDHVGHDNGYYLGQQCRL